MIYSRMRGEYGIWAQHGKEIDELEGLCDLLNREGEGLVLWRRLVNSPSYLDSLIRYLDSLQQVLAAGHTNCTKSDAFLVVRLASVFSHYDSLHHEYRAQVLTSVCQLAGGIIDNVTAQIDEEYIDYDCAQVTAIVHLVGISFTAKHRGYEILISLQSGRVMERVADYFENTRGLERKSDRFRQNIQLLSKAIRDISEFGFSEN